MATTDSKIPSADDLRRLLAEKYAREASSLAQKAQAEHDRKMKLIEELSTRRVTPERIDRAIRRLQELAAAGQTEVMILQFPNELCTDRGRAINSLEAGWEKSLTGFPRDVFDAWAEHFRSRGYKLSAKIVEFPEGKPGDVGLFMSW